MESFKFQHVEIKYMVHILRLGIVLHSNVAEVLDWDKIVFLL